MKSKHYISIFTIIFIVGIIIFSAIYISFCIKNNIEKNEKILIISFIVFLILFFIILILLFQKKYIKTINNFISTQNKINTLLQHNKTNEIKTLLQDKKNKISSLDKKVSINYEFLLEQNLTYIQQKIDFKNQFENLQFSNEVGRFILTKIEIKDIIIDAYNELGILFQMNTFTIGLHNKNNNSLNIWRINTINNKLQQFSANIDKEESLSIYCLKNSKEIFINDFKKEYKQYHLNPAKVLSLNKSMIYLPLISLTDRTIGIISVKSKKRNSYKKYHLNILKNLSIFVITALENSKIYEQLNSQKVEIIERNEALNQQKEEISNINENLTYQKIELEKAFKDIQLLSKIGQDITSSIKIDEITTIVHKNIVKLLDATFFGIGIYEEKSNKLIFRNVIEKGRFLTPYSVSVERDKTLAVLAFNKFETILINDIEKEYNKYFEKFPKPVHGELSQSIIYIPLAVKGQKLGVLTVQSSEKNSYSELDLNILQSLASYISIAISNANAFEENERHRKEIQKLAQQVEIQLNAVEESDEKMTNIINFIPDPLMVIDKNGKVVIWNNNMEKLTGIKAEKIINKNNYEHSLAFYNERRPMLADILLEPSEKIKKKYSSLKKTDNIISAEGYVPKLNKYLWGSATYLYNSNNDIIGVIQVSRDITEKNKQQNKIEIQKKEILLKQTELHELIEELQTTNLIIEDTNKDLERLSIVASKTDNAVVIMNDEADIEWVNDAFKELHEISQQEFIKKRGRNWYNACYNADIKGIIDVSIREKKSSIYTSKISQNNNKYKWIQTTLTPIFDDNSKLKNIIAVQTDISEIIDAEKEIKKQNKKIRHSIKYARRIQTAVLPPKRFIERTLAEHFILYKPRDIVSGDFYWITRKKTKILIAIADCTGHGVPGAFMSMLGISFLNEITNKIYEKDDVEGLQAAKILNLLKINVIKSLHQKRNAETKDGIDLSLCILDLDTQYIQYAGANNPLFIIREKNENNKIDIPQKYTRTFENKNACLTEVKADKSPIGFSEKYIDKFKDKKFHTKKGDSIYMFTDGFADQFGGEKGRKFLISNLRKLFLEIYNKPMKEQEVILNTTIHKWMDYKRDDGKKHYQIDDILIMGMKF